jgi:hypothetical protein
VVAFFYNRWKLITVRRRNPEPKANNRSARRRKGSTNTRHSTITRYTTPSCNATSLPIRRIINSCISTPMGTSFPMSRLYLIRVRVEKLPSPPIELIDVLKIAEVRGKKKSNHAAMQEADLES